MVKEPPSKEEVERAKTRQLKDIEFQLRDSEKIGLFMSEWASMGDWRLMYLDRDRLRKVTPEDVQRVAKAYLKSSNRTIAEFIPDPKPDRSVIPAKTDYRSRAERLQRRRRDGAGRSLRSLAREYRIASRSGRSSPLA